MQAQTKDRAFMDGVRAYYDKNTPRFVRSHPSAIASAIHREVWGPGVRSEKEAFEYVNALVLQSIAEIAGSFSSPIRALDLGCGVGGTLLYLASRMPLEGIGITISPVGVRRAERLASAAGLAAQCRFVESNYLELPGLGVQDVVYAIEAFLHGPDAAKFFRSAAGVMSRGGRLIVCDDFLTSLGLANSDRQGKRNLADFRRGWHVGSLITTADAGAHAETAGLRLVQNLDLTPYLRLRRPRDRVIAAFVTAGRAFPLRSPWWDSWVGGHAIQKCLLARLIEYRFLVFEKTS